jgi:aspartyl-tRNA(Asn)/glutamyl-tRNA(Gln) amidotransferase subunit C
MKLSREEVQHLARLVRLGLSDDEIEMFRVQLSNILENFEILSQVDTSKLKPTAQAIELQNVFRRDIPQASYPPVDILINAPEQDNGFFKVQAVFE